MSASEEIARCRSVGAFSGSLHLPFRLHGRKIARESQPGMAKTPKTRGVYTQYSCTRRVNTSAEFPVFLCETLWTLWLKRNTIRAPFHHPSHSHAISVSIACAIGPICPIASLHAAEPVVPQGRDVVSYGIARDVPPSGLKHMIDSAAQYSSAAFRRTVRGHARSMSRARSCGCSRDVISSPSRSLCCNHPSRYPATSGGAGLIG
ncbi:MAG: hypothetical protein RLZZ436_2269 [Planctomycetota bacterium]|jgi:hypothetical protein